MDGWLSFWGRIETLSRGNATCTPIRLPAAPAADRAADRWAVKAQPSRTRRSAARPADTKGEGDA
jgi:hypothetical protein